MIQVWHMEILGTRRTYTPDNAKFCQQIWNHKIILSSRGQNDNPTGKWSILQKEGGVVPIALLHTPIITYTQDKWMSKNYLRPIYKAMHLVCHRPLKKYNCNSFNINVHGHIKSGKRLNSM